MSQLITILDSIFKANGGTTRQWRNANEILLTHTEEVKKYCAYMKNKIRDLNKNIQLLALDFLDYSIDDGKIPLWTQVGSKEFLTSLVNIYKTRNDQEVQIKILYLIKKWANKFQKYNTIIPNFTSTYENLKNNDVEFPDDIESTYEKYLGNDNEGNNKSNNNKYNNINNLVSSENKNYVKKINLDLRTTSYERKYKRLVNKLDDWTQQIQDANVLMDMANENGFDDELRGICNDLETGKTQLIDTIESGKLKDEKLMQISLGVQDDIEMTLKRWNDVKNGKKPQSFKSSFLNEKNNNDNGFNKNKDNMGNNKQNKGGFDLLGFDDDFGGNNNNSGNNNSNNNNMLGNDLFDVFSGNNNNNNNMGNTNNFNNNNQNMGNNNDNNQNNNLNFFGNNNGQNNQNLNNINFFDNNNNLNNNQQNNQNNNNNFFGNNNINQNNQNNGNNNDLYSQIFNMNENKNNQIINNLQSNLNSVYKESGQFGIDFTNNNNNNNNINNNNLNNNNNNFNNIMLFTGSSDNNFNFNDNNNQNNKNTSNRDFNFNF